MAEKTGMKSIEKKNGTQKMRKLKKIKKINFFFLLYFTSKSIVVCMIGGF